MGGFLLGLRVKKCSKINSLEAILQHLPPNVGPVKGLAIGAVTSGEGRSLGPPHGHRSGQAKSISARPNRRFAASLLTITAGRVLRISLPTAGSNATHHKSLPVDNKDFNRLLP